MTRFEEEETKAWVIQPQGQATRCRIPAQPRSNTAEGPHRKALFLHGRSTDRRGTDQRPSPRTLGGSKLRNWGLVHFQVPWCARQVWLRGLGVVLRSGRSMARFSVRHTPGCWFDIWWGRVREAASQCFSLTPLFLSLSFSLPSPLSKNK